MVRKQRTRGHIIADLSANHVERHILLCGYSVERVFHDYGVDLLLTTYTEDGQVENEMVKIQLKATDHLSILKDGQTIALSVERADLDYWAGERLPVILIVYDAPADMAYWLYIQAHYAPRDLSDLTGAGATITVHLSTSNIVNTDAIRRFASYKADVVRQMQGMDYHEE